MHMAWLGQSQGIFRLHRSDAYCGSYISVEDVAEIFDTDSHDVRRWPLQRTAVDGEEFISELDIHRAWNKGDIQSVHRPKVGSASRSFDELIVIKLLKLNLPGCSVDAQVPFGRKSADIRVTYRGTSIVIEFVGPSHFIPQYERGVSSPLLRKQEIEDFFGCECVIWPFWIQRCARNVYALFNSERTGLASVWSTKAFFGDFAYSDSADIIVKLTDRFGAIKANGIGYMYGNSHANKPVHPVVAAIQNGKTSKSVLIPKGNTFEEFYWLPGELHD